MSAAGSIARPRVVVGIVVDQMRWDYLYRYYSRYKAGGFKRMLGEGFSCDQAFINYLPSYTGPGHACIYTGSVPAIHGIAGNEWIEAATGRYTYCVEDTTVATVGAPGRAGMMSPRNLQANTVGDELRLATNFKSRVFALSLKDRASILPGGFTANGAYWLDNSGNFITSTFYRNALPAWLSGFNARKLPDSLLRHNWNLMYPMDGYVQSLADSNAYEGKVKGGGITFPHNTAQYAGTAIGNIRALPAGNTLMLELAKACIKGERIGQGSEPDMLCLSFSATDYIGHQFSPNSVEMEDCYLRLDAELARLFVFLDAEYGKGNYLAFLTADHGGAHNGNFLKDEKMPGGVLYDSALLKRMNALLKPFTRSDSSVRLIENYQVYFKESVFNHPGLSESISVTSAAEMVRNWLVTQDFVQYAELLPSGTNNAIPEPLRTMMINGWYAGRSGQVQYIPKPGYYAGYAPTGTTHGTWNAYDTHIPLLWYGWRIPKGSSNRKVYMTDIAATLAALLHIQMPNGCVGSVITEVAP